MYINREKEKEKENGSQNEREIGYMCSVFCSAEWLCCDVPELPRHSFVARGLDTTTTARSVPRSACLKRRSRSRGKKAGRAWCSTQTR